MPIEIVFAGVSKPKTLSDVFHGLLPDYVAYSYDPQIKTGLIQPCAENRSCQKELLLETLNNALRNVFGRKAGNIQITNLDGAIGTTLVLEERWLSIVPT